MLLLAVYGIASKYFGKNVGLVSAFFIYSLPLTTELSTGAMPEHVSTFLTLMSFWALLNIFEEDNKNKLQWLILAGILGGCSGATKLWGLLGGPATFCILIYLWYSTQKTKLKSLLCYLFIFSISFGIVLMPWFVRNYMASGNPLWPMGYHLFETKFWSDISVQKYSQWTRGPGTSFIDFIKGPWMLTNNIENIQLDTEL